MSEDPRSLGRIAVLMGGLSSEREVSLMSGNGVLAALRSRGADAHAFDPATQPLQALKDGGFERAFIALHGRYGEDGTVQGALELLGIPYTGSGVMASAIAMDKVRTKQIWVAQGLPTPRFLSVSEVGQLDDLVEYLGLPLIMKPPHEGSTIGITRVTAADQLVEAFAAAARLDREVLAEEFIAGRELTVAVLGSGESAMALPIVEIQAPDGNYDYQNKYFSDDTRYLCPAPLPEALARDIARIAVTAYRAIGCEGWGRVDFMLSSRDDRPWLLEVNTAPGMTGHSLVPMAARAVGMSYEDLVLEITASASLKIRRVPAPARSGGGVEGNGAP
ncbi:MAG: D-alanine--D-alanine ligase [Burkholderiaceae bacterium]|nr:D-alanine--D-alanine ligase [Burkholderiaceae bacterium]